MPRPATPAKWWDKEVLIATIPRTASTVYRVSYATRGQREYLVVREWYINDDPTKQGPDPADPRWFPSKNGMSIFLEEATPIIDALLNGAERAINGDFA